MLSTLVFIAQNIYLKNPFKYPITEFYNELLPTAGGLAGMVAVDFLHGRRL
jgi:hypothetical protein